MRFAVAIVLLVSLSGLSAFSTDSDRRYSRAHQQCRDAAGGFTKQILDCNGREMDRQDRALNRAYRITMGKLSADQKRGLRSLQRDWLRQHDADCFRKSGGRWAGTAGSIDYSDCMLEATITRTIWLERYSPSVK